MDILKAHRVAGVQEMLSAAGVRVVYLPPYSPEFNPIEQIGMGVKSLCPAILSLKTGIPLEH